MFSLSSAFNHLSLFCFINNSICLDRLPFLVLSFNYLIIMVAASLFCIHLSFCRYQKRSWSGGELIFLMGLKCFSVNPLLCSSTFNIELQMISNYSLMLSKFELIFFQLWIPWKSTSIVPWICFDDLPWFFYVRIENIRAIYEN